MLDHTSSKLAANLKCLREARGFTQAELAELSEVPRPTLAHLESGGANPTLGVLIKVAGALQVPIEELIREPQAAIVHYPVGSLPSRTRGKVVVQQLLPDRIPGMSIERLEFPAGTRLSSAAGSANTRRYVTCEAGELELSSGGEVWRLRRAELVVLRSDQKHVLTNRGRGKAIAYSVVALAPFAD